MKTQADIAVVKGRSLWSEARRRFYKNIAAMLGLIVLILVSLFAFFGQYIAQFPIDEIDFNVIGQVEQEGGPSIKNGHYFGTDDLGRDLFARVVQGTQVSLIVGFVGAFIAVAMGTLYGAIAGYAGGRTDNIMMRVVDILMAIPSMFVIILLLVMFGRSMAMLFIGVGMLSWLDMSRIVRGQTLSIKNKEYIHAAQAMGVSDVKIITRHILPNLWGIVAVYATLLIPLMILTESFISFIGLGVQEPLTSWGALISEGAGTMQYGTLWQLTFPLFFFVITISAFYFVGDGLRDALDPKER